jgi:protein gp37
MFAVMAEASWHVFQVLTKRPQRMHDYLAPGEARRQIVDRVACKMHQSGEIRMREDAWLGAWPLPNVWLGVSVEDQETADERIPVLLNTPAAVRWISAEPLLGPIDLTNIELPARYALSITTAAHVNALTASDDEHFYNHHASLNWCVVGGESGVDARPMHPDWARSLRDQCAAAKVPFFFKQWGDCRQVAGKFPEKKAGHIARDGTHIRDVVLLDPNETLAHRLEAALNDGKWHWAWMEHVGKKAAGRALDGREWNEYPA